MVKFFSLHFLEVSINFKQFWKLKAFSGLLSQFNEIRKQNGKEKTSHWVDSACEPGVNLAAWQGVLLGRLAGRPGPHFGPGGNQAGASSAIALAWWCNDRCAGGVRGHAGGGEPHPQRHQIVSWAAQD
jgi:hypothetical protein